MALNRVDEWDRGKGAKFTCAECMQESLVNNHTEQAWRQFDAYQSLMESDFFREYDYVDKTQQAQ